MFQSFAKAAAGIDGGNDQFTKILLHMDGADGSTNYPDVNAGGLNNPHVWTPQNSVAIDTALSVFGGASNLHPTTGSGHLLGPQSADFITGSEDFTVDFWFLVSFTSAQRRFLYSNADESGFIAYGFEITDTHVLRAIVSPPGGPSNFVGTGTTNVGQDTSNWHHVAMVKQGTGTILYLDGAVEISGSNSASVSNPTGITRMGGFNNALNFVYGGWIDEVRLSVGIARWTAPFIPPTEAYF